MLRISIFLVIICISLPMSFGQRLTILADNIASPRSPQDKILCIKYKRNDGSSSNSYMLPYIMSTGSDLNRALGEYRYMNYNNYIVAQWPNGGASIFNLGAFRSGTFNSTLGLQIKDQTGKSFSIIKLDRRHRSCPIF